MNYIGEGRYGGIVSNTGGGYSFDRDPKNRRVTRYRYNAIPADQPGRSGVTPLAAAAFNGKDRLVALLLAHRADPLALDSTGKSPIVYAAARGHRAIVDRLLGAGVPVDTRHGNGLTALMWAAGHANDVPEAHLAFGVGIHYGDAVLGLIGTEKRLEYTAIGDSVNTTKRLQENAGKNQIVISQEAYERVKEQVNVLQMEPITVKGKRQLISVYEVLGLK